MHARDIAVLALLLMPVVAPMATEAEGNTVNYEVDTFSKLLAKQVLLVESEIDAKINANQASTKSKTNDRSTVTVSPLAEVKQQFNEEEPVVQAIWGLAGKEVAEVFYQGQRVPVSMQEPFISRIDGWKLHSINSYEIVLVKNKHGKETARKQISLNWGQGTGSAVTNERNIFPASMQHRTAVNY